MALLDFAIVTAIVACVSAWILLLLGKWNAIEWLATNGNELVSKMAQCNFCLSWWANVAVACFVMVAFDLGIVMICVPFVATPITRKMLW